MRKQDTQVLADVLAEVLKYNNLDSHLNEMKVVEMWYEKVGHNAKRYTTEAFVKEKKLFVRLSSSILKNELMLGRTSLAEKLNEAVGLDVINEIVFL